MGSMTTDLPISCTTGMLNNWEILGQFIIRPRIYPLAALPEAMEAAATAGNLECVVIQP
jgi:alcohol dehydrogenase